LIGFSHRFTNERFPVALQVKNFSTPMLVVAAALLGDGGRFLMHRRPEGKAHGGLWEFPGGKVEAAEMPGNALVRELEEELGITCDPVSLTPTGFAEQAAADGHPAIVILLYTLVSWTGDPVALEGGQVGWFTLDEAKGLPKPPLDSVLLAQLERIVAGGQTRVALSQGGA
jgi:8-oxo-dGTP diphosphatase